jgi:hypothetical protein
MLTMPHATYWSRDKFGRAANSPQHVPFPSRGERGPKDSITRKLRGHSGMLEIKQWGLAHADAIFRQ